MVEYAEFLKWAESRFSDVVVSGDEIKLNSIFVEDYKHHLWCNPAGGKNEREHGVYHCWKSGERGTLVNLVKQVDKCTYDEALELLGTDSGLADLEQRLEEFMAAQQPFSAISEPEPENKLAYPEGTLPITSLPNSNFWRVESETYLLGRKLNPHDYLICTTDKDYKNRIVIPYFDKDCKLIYWNARFLNDSDKVAKYLGPDKACGVGKGDVIYMAGNWPPMGARLYLTEGEFDAKSLAQAGFYAAALGGKDITERQIELIRDFIPVLAFDNDFGKKVDAGGEAVLSVGDKLKQAGFKSVYFVRPPTTYKDWNAMLVDTSHRLINAYVLQHVKPYSFETRIQMATIR